ncbi:MAG TPA: hypothetical protein VFB90_06005 [Dehalococcoidia bacterium]|nr:hypothetical protein [Dehalococcoidia bacterium]
MRLLRGLLIGLGLGFLVSRFAKSNRKEAAAQPDYDDEPSLEPDDGVTAKAGRIAYAIKEQFRYAWREAAAEAGQHEEELLQEFRGYQRKPPREKKRGLFRRG